ncbi:MAG: hypothetical protein ACOX2K_06815 [Bacillota bacterium]|jgi:hypothetical protein
MRTTRLYSAILCVIMLLTLMQTTALAADTITDVGTAAELRAALENDAGAHVRLTKDISFTTSNAADRNVGVYLGKGCYTIDLNGFALKYSYRTGGEFSDNGSPVDSGEAKLLVVNGPGTMTGGTNGLEQTDQFGTLVVNGGTFKGVMGYGIRMTGGIAYINGGNITGNFGGIEHEDGLLVLNGGEIKSVRQTGQRQPRKRGLVRDGVFTGNTVLEDVVLSVDDLTIAKGSSMRVIRGGGLIVRNSFVNNGTFTCEGGLQCIGGEGTIKPDIQGNHTPVTILFDTSFNSLEVQEKAALQIGNGATVTVTGEFFTGKNSHVDAENGTLRLFGSIDHRGRADGVPELDAGNGGNGPRDFVRETEAAMRLKALGLFQGVGTNPDGSTNFDLTRAPSRTEALVMLIRLLGKDDEANGGSWKHPFIDVPGWANEVVGYAWEKGLTKGISATEFGTGRATAQMYLTFVLRALGYADAPGFQFTWDQPEEVARSVGILPDSVHRDDFMRADMVLISEAALSAKLHDSGITLLEKLVSEGAITPPEQSGLPEDLTAPGLVSVTLTRDEILDVTGLALGGGKEIILNDFTLTLTGELRVTDDLYLDIHPGEGLSGGGIDMSALRFDLSHLPQGLTGEMSFIEIHPVTMVSLPPQGGGIVVHKLPDMLTVISCVLGQ